MGARKGRQAGPARAAIGVGDQRRPPGWVGAAARGRLRRRGGGSSPELCGLGASFVRQPTAGRAALGRECTGTRRRGGWLETWAAESGLVADLTGKTGPTRDGLVGSGVRELGPPGSAPFRHAFSHAERTDGPTRRLLGVGVRPPVPSTVFYDSVPVAMCAQGMLRAVFVRMSPSVLVAGAASKTGSLSLLACRFPFFGHVKPRCPASNLVFTARWF